MESENQESNIACYQEDAKTFNKNSIDVLLNACIPRKKQIDFIELHFDGIISARQRKVCWDSIAETLHISRSTLINGIKIIKMRKLLMTNTPSHKKQNNLFFEKKYDELNQINAKKDLGNHEDKRIPDTGIKALGRANINQFNL